MVSPSITRTTSALTHAGGSEVRLPAVDFVVVSASVEVEAWVAEAGMVVGTGGVVVVDGGTRVARVVEIDAASFWPAVPAQTPATKTTGNATAPRMIQVRLLTASRSLPAGNVPVPSRKLARAPAQPRS
jgi:hypothetical protein